ncbi:hypothetical protein HDU83_002135 [Entophlyctis luteolus]|nr:hypothetical protein HDU82_003285 [Entophlyctis luteolus]KAJ3347376.1 hypothetical protein HDU83_002135 [Entophlyctis luteolus]KAJ3380630.1 hypothetical protein HDU84_005679 [Entophlyctis sp. JEL0112]
MPDHKRPHEEAEAEKSTPSSPPVTKRIYRKPFLDDDTESEEAEPVVRGTCMCGETTVALKSFPESDPSFCHCNSCRKWSGAPFLLYVSTPTSSIEIAGPVNEKKTYSGAWDTYRGRCGSCGTPLYARLGNPSESMYLVMTLFADEHGKFPDGFRKPASHNWYSSRVMDVKDGLKKLKEYDEEIEE